MNILVISPHADDETLGAGGTLLKLKASGHDLFWLNITDMKEEYHYEPARAERRTMEISRVCQEYGIQNFFNLGLEPAGLDKLPLTFIIEKISLVVKEVCPSIVILPFPYDIHSDHEIVFQAAFACTKKFRFPSIHTILCMEVLSETDYAFTQDGFTANYFVDITPFLEKKLSILRLYESEMGMPPFPRSEEAVRGLASYRGASCGARYAEAFHIVKIIR